MYARHKLSYIFLAIRGRCIGLMISALHSGSKGAGFSPARYIVLCSGQDTLLSQYLSSPYKWVLANFMLGVTLRCTSIPSRGSRSTPSRFMLQKPEISAGLMVHFASKKCSNVLVYSGECTGLATPS